MVQIKRLRARASRSPYHLLRGRRKLQSREGLHPLNTIYQDFRPLVEDEWDLLIYDGWTRLGCVANPIKTFNVNDCACHQLNW